MPAKTWAANKAAVVSELLTAGSKTSLKRSVKISRLPNMPDNALIMLLSCAIKKSIIKFHY